MMVKYSKPMVTVDQGLAEGVYAASGCYTASAYIHQTPHTGRGDYRITGKMEKHNADHTREGTGSDNSFN